MESTQVLISGVDFERLSDVVESPRYRAKTRAPLADLRQGLGRGTVIAPTDVPADIVTMRSRVRVRDLQTRTAEVYTLVYPEEADFSLGKVSVLAPLGSALLGARAGSVIKVDAPAGVRRVKVERVLYQPEAAGDFQL
jgi:regulator of nucleoside diphosphate kinase